MRELSGREKVIHLESELPAGLGESGQAAAKHMEGE